MSYLCSMKDKKSALIAEETFKWCCEYLGTPLKKYPKLTLNTDKRYSRKYGEYQNKEIVVFMNTCKGRKDIIGTIIHEYTHFLQMPRKKDINKYHKLLEIHRYKDHPFEVEAEEFAKLYHSQVLEHFRKKGIII